VAEKIDVFQLAGGRNKPLVKEFTGLDAGTELTIEFVPAAVSPAPDQMPVLQGIEVLREQVLTLGFGVPSFLVNDTEKTTTWGSGIEQMMLGFYTLTMRPYLERWESAINNALLTPGQRASGVYAEFDFDALLRADMTGRANYYSQMVQNGILSRNEVRARENLPPFVGGDTYTAQVNMAPVSSLGANSGTQTAGA
jgi:phage portal protein BeeE